MLKTAFFAGALASLAAAALPAHAQTGTAPRTWLSGTGADSGSCSFTSPCRSLHYAITQVKPGGQILLLDQVGYGAVTITASVSIIAEGRIALINAPAGDGITINAGANDSVVLRGLTVDGLGGGSNGIVFNSGGSLIIDKCNVLNFVGSGSSGNGILLQPAPTASPTITISETNASNNAYKGIWLMGTSSANVDIERVVTSRNEYGTDLEGSSSSFFSISNSIASHNRVRGFFVQGSTSALAIKLDSLTAIHNGTGILAAAPLYLGRSVVSGNSAYGVLVGSAGTVYSYRNNEIDGNFTDISGTVTTRNLQ
jgi:hypothetical protein